MSGTTKKTVQRKCSMCERRVTEVLVTTNVPKVQPVWLYVCHSCDRVG